MLDISYNTQCLHIQVGKLGHERSQVLLNGWNCYSDRRRFVGYPFVDGIDALEVHIESSIDSFGILEVETKLLGISETFNISILPSSRSPRLYRRTMRRVSEQVCMDHGLPPALGLP